MERDSVTFNEFLEHLMSDDEKKIENLSRSKVVKIDKNVVLCCDKLRRVSSTLDSISSGLKYYQTYQFSSYEKLDEIIDTLKSLHDEVNTIQSELEMTFKFNKT